MLLVDFFLVREYLFRREVWRQSPLGRTTSMRSIKFMMPPKREAKESVAELAMRAPMVSRGSALTGSMRP